MLEHEDECYELFRQAIVKRDAEAWSAIHQRFHPLLVSWAWRCGEGACSAEECADIADQALARAWMALSPERFADFPTLARLLGYLRACVMTAKFDVFRMQVAGDNILSDQHIDAAPTPEQTVLANLDRSTLWHTAMALTSNTAERMALIDSFVYGLPPRTIRERHPHLFPDVAAVYSAKRNLIERLRRNPELRRLYEEFVTA